MNTKKWLTLGLSVALAGCLGWAVAACSPTEPNPNEGDNPSTPHTHTFTAWDHSETEHWRVCPDDGELDVSSRAPHNVNKKTHTCECGYVEPHDHTYTQWAHDANQHWMVCPDDGAVDPDFPKADHSFNEDGACECGYTLPEIYITGHIVSQPGSLWAREFRLNGTGKNGIRENCIKMERGADGKYTAEVFLHTRDWFTVCDCTSVSESGNEYTDLRRQVDADNVYILTWEPGATEISARIHDHKFVDQYGYDANEHWLVCSDADHTPDTTKTPHDFTKGNTCVCGAVKECQHENGYKFSYETLPECKTAGGTLQKTCPDCADTQDVTYDVGVDGGDGSSVFLSTALMTSSKKINCNLNIGQSVYLANSSLYLQMAITEAGTYTVNIDTVKLPVQSQGKNAAFVLGLFGLSTTSIEGGKAPDADLIWYKGAFHTKNTNAQSAATGHSLKVNGKDLADYHIYSDDVNTISFTVTEEDLASGTVYVTMTIGYEASAESFYSYHGLGYFVSTKKETV